MSTKANGAGSAGSGAGGSYNTQRHSGGARRRRSSARHSETTKIRGADEQPAASATAAALAPAATATTAKTRGDSYRSHAPRATAATNRPQHLNEKKLDRQDSAATATTTANTGAAATAAAAPTPTFSKALNALSPEFVPRQLQQATSQSGMEVTNALSFSALTSPLAYVGSTGIASSVSSPLMFATSTALVAAAAAPAAATHGRPSLTSPASASLSEPMSTPLALPLHMSGGSAVASPPSTSAMQLRDAYARAAAAKATAAATAAAAAAANNGETPSASLTSPFSTPLVRPASAVPPGAGGSYTFSVVEGRAVPVVSPQPQPHSQRCSARNTVNSTPSVAPAATTGTTAAAAPAAPAAVYGPSVAVFHPQFVDVATGATSLTPFALRDDYVDELTLENTGAAAVVEGEVAAMAQEIIDALPPPSQQLQQYQVEQLQHQQQFAAQHRRSSATTVAILGSHDAPTAQLAMPATTRRAERLVTQPSQQQQQQPSSQPYTSTTFPAMATQSIDECRSEEAVTVTARPSPSSQRRTTTTVLTTTTSTTASIHYSNTAEAVPGEETPQRRTRKVATTSSTCTTATTADVKNSGAATVERLYACLANTDERTEDGRSATSKMGLTGSVRRNPQPRRPSAGYRNNCSDDDDEHNDAAERSSTASDVMTPTLTPAKVLAVEGSPFLAAAAAENAHVAAAAGAEEPRADRRLLAEEDNAIVFSEATRHGSGRAPQKSNCGHLQRAMIQLMAQIQTNNSKATAAAANKPAPTATATASAGTPKKASATANGAASAAAGTESTPASFKTPEVERVPSARPSASKNATCRTITTIIQTPKSTHSSSTAEATTATKGAQRSLASCLEAIAPVKRIAAHDSAASPLSAAVATRPLATRPVNMTSSSSAFESAASTSSASAAGVAATHANPSAMPVPRSQRRGGRQASPSQSAYATSAVNNSSMASSTTIATTPTTTAVTSPLLASLSTAAAQATQYAVVIEGHMGRRVTAVSPTPLKAGVCVLFEEDRGIDLGRVVQCTTLEDSQAAGGLPTLASATSPLSRKDRPAPVLRPATAEEEYRWLYADVREAEATLEPCREAAARLGLPVKVVGAVYQFNKAKLTFYYESDTRVDFRPLLPSLFSRFHCRIWMSRVEAMETAKGDRAALAADAMA